MRKFLAGLAGCLALTLVYFVWLKPAQLIPTSKQTDVLAAEQIQQPPIIKKPTLIFGIAADSLQVLYDTIKNGQTLSEILQNYNFSPAKMDELRQKSKSIFNLRQIQANKPYTLLYATDSAQSARYFIYQPSLTEYVVFNLQDSMHVYKVEEEIEIAERTLAGTITSSLYVAMAEAGCSPGLINHFADIYSWKINFAAIQPGDNFKLIYEEHLLKGQPIGYGKVIGAFFEHRGKALYAIRYGEGKNQGYYDNRGKSLQKAFLKEPLEYSRISSRFSSRRFHPVQKRYKAHLGTDFAAPRGTPVRSVGQGIVVAVGYTSGNGNYVKIKHDKTYTTQYLHLSKFAKGIRKGTHVNLGQTIGYVGSTGLASGPHLCYRFWKNGRQVDVLREKLPEANAISKEDKERFAQLSQELITKLASIEKQEPVATTQIGVKDADL